MLSITYFFRKIATAEAIDQMPIKVKIIVKNILTGNPKLYL